MPVPSGLANGGQLSSAAKINSSPETAKQEKDKQITARITCFFICKNKGKNFTKRPHQKASAGINHTT
tara:strand:+ start:1107 stop:1310 length:204 start_codon:yes stop_codon:yes gene_type:complete